MTSPRRWQNVENDQPSLWIWLTSPLPLLLYKESVSLSSDVFLHVLLSYGPCFRKTCTYSLSLPTYQPTI